jgi:hypothetical protein
MFELNAIHVSIVAVLVTIWYMLLRPRRGHTKNPPPLVTFSKKYPVPLIGQLIEFFSSPHEMMKRCYNDYGPVFTIPVRLQL